MSSELEPDLRELPAAYSRWRNSELGQITDRIEEDLVLHLIGPVTGKRLLDVGCGDGALCVRLAQGGADATGLDNEPRMLAAARRRASDAGLQVSFIDGNAQALPLDDCSFDIVVAVAVLCFVAAPAHAFREMARVLRPGGRLVIGELGRYSRWAAKRRIAGWLASKTWRLARFRTASDLEKLSVEAGLEVETVRGTVYYPPGNLCARWLAPFDERFSRLTTVGAAFLTLGAGKPMQFPEDQR